MGNSKNSPRPSFFWQGLMIVLPVTVLAVVGLFSLRQDEQAAEQAARKKAAENVASLARAMSVIAGDQFKNYFFLQMDWVQMFRTTFGTPTSEAAAVRYFGREGPKRLQDIQARIVQWEKAYPGLHFESVAAPMGTLSDQGIPFSPTEVAAPVPPKWFLEFSASQRQAWDRLRQCQSTEHSPDALVRSWQEFLDTNPPEEARLAASNYARLNNNNEEQEYYKSVTESGIPFSDLFLMQAIDRAANSGWPSYLLGKLWINANYSPSFLTSALLEKAGQNPPAGDLLQEQFRHIQKVWDMDSIARERLLPFRLHPELLSTNLWTSSSAGEALAVRYDTTLSGIGPDQHATCIWFAPLPVVKAIFDRALAENKFLVPEYVTPVISVEGEPLPLSDFVRPTDEKLRLAGVTRNCEDYPISFSVTFYLTSPEKMLAAETRRTRLFGALIGGAVLAALAGLLAARRAFYSQHRLSEMKSNFVSSVSHELRAPIASMRLLSESLERGKISEGGKKQEYYRFLVQESRRLTSLIENVLDFSRIEQGRKEYQIEPADLDAIVEETIKLMQPGAAEKQVGLFRRPFIGPGPLVCCDGLALQQALINLIDNAVKHSSPGANVEVGLEDGAPNGVRLWVEDQGPGIPPEEHEKIFERFYRRGSELRRETQGIGIGLTIVKHIVEAHGGRVRVRSAVGQGSRFTIELPAASEHT